MQSLTSTYLPLLLSAGQVGQISQFLKDPSAPECATAESLGSALFAHESFEGWSSHFSVNGASIFFVTNAFLGLLAKGGEEVPGYWSSVVNITSISGVIKVAQGHVRQIRVVPADRLTN